MHPYTATYTLVPTANARNRLNQDAACALCIMRRSHRPRGGLARRVARQTGATIDMADPVIFPTADAIVPIVEDIKPTVWGRPQLATALSRGRRVLARGPDTSLATHA